VQRTIVTNVYTKPAVLENAATLAKRRISQKIKQVMSD